jgi:hypothetical protein
MLRPIFALCALLLALLVDAAGTLILTFALLKRMPFEVGAALPRG